jgi:hypothetical protein
MSANISPAVMQQRHEAPDSLDFFPTPPWATRALMETLSARGYVYHRSTVWEPACGEGHMAEVLREYFATVDASDIHDYGRGYRVGDFCGTLLRSETASQPDWIITNPPYNAAAEFLVRALEEAWAGVALLLRISWLEGAERYHTIFTRHPPTTVAVFAGRVSMVKGCWDPDASRPTSYAWFIWDKTASVGRPELTWIRPEAQAELTKPHDVRFARRGAAEAP